MAVRNYYDLPVHSHNQDLTYYSPVMPLPDSKKDLPYKYNEYSDVDEPRFDPKVHLNIESPEYVTLLPEYKRVKETKGGSLAYSQPFQFLSAKGIEVMRKIVAREKPDCGPSRGCRIALRGLYYTSPWVRDLHNCPLVLDLVSSIAGERLVPTHHINAAPQVNFSIPGMSGAAEFWHWDSISYVGNFLLNDVDNMEGGDLEIIKMQKHEGMEALVSGTLKPENVERLVYGPPGKMVLCQGSEVLHHVTPVKSEFSRIVVIMCFAPANVFKPDKLVLATEIQEDKSTNHEASAKYEFFRGRAWVCGNALVGMTTKVPFTDNGKVLAGRLRSVVHELERVANLLEGNTNDTIGFFNEDNGKHGARYLGDK